MIPYTTRKNKITYGVMKYNVWCVSIYINMVWLQRKTKIYIVQNKYNIGTCGRTRSCDVTIISYSAMQWNSVEWTKI